MRHVTRVVLSAAAALALAGCGSQATPTSPPTSVSTSPPTGTSTSPPTGGSQPKVFPVTITRTGGIAGFHDVVVMRADGMVTVTRKGQKQRACQLEPLAARALTTAANQIPWASIAPKSTNPSIADELVTLVASPAGKPVRLDDQQLGANGKVLWEVFDSFLVSDRSGLCTRL